jgi:7,8-dihydropterin-6-yl-methyl-4-(beta-D-ribofuranosyl)aminobenzene 5'-phosphate synthase
MKITLIYDNETAREDLVADWGFSCLIEEEKTPTILFDTGTDGSILLSNMRKLNIDPLAIEEVFISHGHFDHIGGLSDFLRINSNVTVYLPASVRGVRGAREVISVHDAMSIHENVFSTGELENIEQSMAVKTDKGIVLIVGCSHPRMKHILDAGSQFGEIYGIIGGLHGFNEFELFRGLKLICPAHCTQHQFEIRALYPEKCVSGGAGTIISMT